jgi:hypothetical protein
MSLFVPSSLRCPAGRFERFPELDGLVRLLARLHVSRMVTDKVSRNDRRDGLLIVRWPGNVYLAPHICAETSSELRNESPEPR